MSESELENLTPTDACARLTSEAETLGLTLEATFVPFSHSRNRNDKHPSLNWIVTLKRKGSRGHAIETDYMQGAGHIPGYDRIDTSVVDGANQVKHICESGYLRTTKRLPDPKLADVLHCLLLDAEVLDFPDYADYADSVGGNPDSIEGKKQYDGCMKGALRLRNMLGNDKLVQLQEIARQM